MKQFRSIQDALNYQVYCPICRGRLAIDEHEVDMRIDTDYNRTTLSWSSPESKLVIDLETNAVMSYSLTRSVSPVYGIGSNAPVSYIPSKPYSNITTDGHLMERLIVGCDRCHRYDYVVQVVVRMKTSENTRVESLILNSESVTLDIDGVIHEIRNIYSFGKTEYVRHVNNFDVIQKLYVNPSPISLPLIPLDLEHPYKTLERIKTLVLFS